MATTISTSRQETYKREYHSVGGDATHVIFNFPGHGALYMGSLISLSYQSFRDKVPIYNLGNTNIDGFAIGKRYVAGSLIRTIFLHDDLSDFLTKITKAIGLKKNIDSIYQNKLEKMRTYHHLMFDDIIPFDIIILLSSEYGAYSVSEVIYGATLINSGQVHSINDLIAEGTMSFVARDVRQTRDKIGSVKYGQALTNDRKASDLGDKADYKQESQFKNKEAEQLNQIFNQMKEDANEDGVVTAQELREQTIVSQILRAVNDGEDLSNYIPQINELSDKYKGKVSELVSQSYKNQTGSPRQLPSVFDNKTADKNTFVYRNNPSSDPSEITDGDTVKFKGVKNIGGELYKEEYGTNGNYNTSNNTDKLKEGEYKARLFPIDAPETSHTSDGEDQPFGRESKQFLEEYMKSGKWDEDVRRGYVKNVPYNTYGRHVIYNYNYALAAIKAGMAHYSPSGARLSGATAAEMREMETAYENAKKNGVGLWGQPPVVMPDEWRRKHGNSS